MAASLKSSAPSTRWRPKDSQTRLVLDVEKAKEWLGKGAQATDRVARLLDGVGAIKREAAQ